MTEQLSFFQEYDPLLEVAKRAGVYWTTSKERLRELYRKGPKADEWVRAVKEEYSPYGYAGRYGAGEGPQTINEWTMKTHTIEVGWNDETGRRRTTIRSWKDFAEKVARLIEEGEY